MAPPKLLKVLLLLALCALAPTSIEGKKKKNTMAALVQRRAYAPAPAPAPLAAMRQGRALLADEPEKPEREETLEADKPEEKPAAEAAPKKPAPKPAAQAGVAQPAPQQPAAETPTAEEPAAEKPAAEEPMEEAPAPAADVEEDPSKPQKAWGQCGGTAPSAEANLTWAGPTTCEEGATCVHLSKTFQQCIPVQQSRAYGCSAVYAQCGGADPGVTTAWSGPFCCPEATECVFFSNTFSQCKPCNAVYEQCGGTIPGTDVPWAGHGRPSCCAAGSSCRYVNNNFYQCQPNASG